MTDLSRRDVVISAGLAAAFGLGLPVALVRPTEAQKTPAPGTPFYKYTVGSFECTAVYDGIWEKPHDPAFIANASVEDVKAAMVKAGLPADFVSIPFTVVVVRNGGKTILCDSGTGGQVQPTAGKMMANMKAAGIDPAQIDTILISHCHPDHIFGLMEKDSNKPVFPDAEIIISDVEYKFWTDPAVIDRLPEARKGLARRIQAVFPTWKNIRQVEGEADVAPGIRFVSAPGHTPGHRAFCAGAGGGQSRLARPVRPGWRDGGSLAAQAARPRHRRQNHDLWLPLPLPRRRHHRQGRHRLCAHRHEDVSERPRL